MEAVGLGVGIAGLVGLFTTVLDAADLLSDYQSVSADANVLGAQLYGHRAAFERWGRRIGLVDGQLNAHHRLAIDTNVASAAEQLLRIANDILTPVNPGRGIDARSDHPLDPARALPLHTERIPMRNKVSWVLRGKKQFTNQVRIFGKIVDQLAKLIPSDTQEQEGEMLKDLQYSEPDHSGIWEVRQIVSQIASERRAEVQREVIAWLLGQTLSSDRYYDSLKKRLDGTCDWILERAEFNQWLSGSSHPLLWINGHAGFGKTIICSRIVEYLLSITEYPKAYFFVSSDVATQDDAYIILRSWASQLATAHIDAFEVARQRWENMVDQTIAPRPTITQILQQTLQSLPDTILIVDGLDECTASQDTGGNVASMLEDLKELATPTTRILIVSRDEPELRESIAANWLEQFHDLKITAEDVRADTKALSHHLVNRRLPKKSDHVRAQLSEAMSDRCDGQFLWLTMQELSLRKSMNQRELERTIQDFPARLSQIYDKYWRSIMGLSESDRERAFSLLRWSAFSLRPLTVSEISEAVILNEDDEEFPFHNLPESVDDDYVDGEIFGLCGPLLEVRSHSDGQTTENKTIHIPHFTVKQYLLSHLPVQIMAENDYVRKSPDRIHHTILGRLCLCYVRSGACWRDEEPPRSESFKASFGQYALSSWHIHITSGIALEHDNHTTQMIQDFMTSTRHQSAWKSWTSWFEAQKPDEEQDFFPPEPGSEPSDPLYFAIKLGFAELANRLMSSTGTFSYDISKEGLSFNMACEMGNMSLAQSFLDAGVDIEAEEPRGRTPLHSAVFTGRAKIVELLVQYGADVSPFDNFGCTPLITAARSGFLKILQILRAHGAEISAADDGWSALHAAAVGGHLDVIQFLLQEGADITATDVIDWTPLTAAVYEGHLEVVRFLLDKMSPAAISADIASLFSAAHHGRLEIAKLLLQKGADASATDGNGWTALNSAAETGQVEVMRLLLEHGASFPAINRSSRTALHVAASNGHLKAVELLLEEGLDPADASSGRTSLHLAAKNGHLKVVESLVSTHPGVLDIQDHDGWSALGLASREGHADVARLLLEEGATHSAPNIYGTTPLIAAASYGHLDILQMLLNYEADISATDNEGWSAVCSAASQGHVEVVRLLLRFGLAISTLNDHGFTAISTAANSGHLAMVQLLLDEGASISSHDSRGRTPVHLAAMTGHIDVIQLLIKEGADTSAATPDGWTPLTLAARNGYPDVVRLLLDQGVDVNVGNGHRWNPLHVATSSGHVEIVRLLVEKGSDTSLRNNLGRTALLLAASNGHAEIVQLLLDHGADLGAMDRQGHTALTLAETMGHVDIVRLISSIYSE